MAASLDSAGAVAAAIRDAIAAALPGAEIRVTPASPGHFEIEVVAAAFAGLAPVRQQQLVYAAIKGLMTGDGAPVHAVDRLRTRSA